MTVVRAASCDEVHFLTSLKFGLWGSNIARFKHWQVGDRLVLVVEKALAGIAEIAGEPFVSEQPIWDGGLFPYRIPLKFVYALGPDIRPSIDGDVWEAFTSAWGPRYGWGLASQSALPEDSAEVIFEAITVRPNELDAICADVDERIQRARERQTHRRIRVLKTLALPKTPKNTRRDEADDTAHTKAQSELVRLGRITGCSVWVATNDRSRVYQGRRLGEDALKSFPNLGLSKELRDRIALIDVLWIRRDMPLYAFEVEVTSTVYSGLLRMADLVALVPVLNVNLFIVAPRERQDKVLRELARPTFQKIGLPAHCRFVATEDLSALLAKVEHLGGHVEPSVIETAAVKLADQHVF